MKDCPDKPKSVRAVLPGEAEPQFAVMEVRRRPGPRMATIKDFKATTVKNSFAALAPRSRTVGGIKALAPRAAQPPGLELCEIQEEILAMQDAAASSTEPLVQRGRPS